MVCIVIGKSGTNILASDETVNTSETLRRIADMIETGPRIVTEPVKPN